MPPTNRPQPAPGDPPEDATVAEAAHLVQEARDLFDQAFEEAPIGKALVSPDGRFLRVNRALCALLDRDPDDVLRASFQDITHPEDLEADLDSVAALLAGDIPRYQMEKRYIRPSGEAVWARLSVSLVRDDAGAPRYFISQIEDISEAKHAQALLADERNALNEAQHIAHVGSWSWDTASDEATWSQEMFRIFDRDPALGPATGEEVFAMVHPDDRERLAAGYAQTFGGGPAFELDYRTIPMRDGRERVIHAHGRRHPDHGHLYVGTVQDVTVLREVEHAARRERDHTRAILASMREGYVLTVDGRISAVNTAMCRLTGFDEGELVGTAFPFPFIPEEDVEKVAREREREATRAATAAGPRAWEAQRRLARKNGERFEAELSIREAWDGDGADLGMVTTVRDVSEERRHQRELERLARTDVLTEVANRRALEEIAAREAKRVERTRRPLSLVMFDIDHFKAINDTHGHPAGDAVLVEIARRLEAAIRECDVVARMGGEEFALLLPDTAAEDAVQVAERAREAIALRRFEQVGWITASAGVATLAPGGDLEAVLQDADRALYEAKRRGRNRILVEAPRLDEAA